MTYIYDQGKFIEIKRLPENQRDKQLTSLIGKKGKQCFCGGKNIRTEKHKSKKTETNPFLYSNVLVGKRRDDKICKNNCQSNFFF